LRVVGSCIRSVVAILPLGSITPVGIRNFYIPGNPGSPDWLSALRLRAFSGFGPVNSSVTRFAFPAVCRASAIVGISHSKALRFLFATSLHSEYHRELTDARVTTFLLARFCNLIFSSFRFPMCFVADSHFQSLCSKHLAVRLFFNSLRSNSSGCFMPFDSFMHSGFQIGFCKLLLRVINLSFSGISTSLLLRSSAASPGPGLSAVVRGPDRLATIRATLLRSDSFTGLAGKAASGLFGSAAPVRRDCLPGVLHGRLRLSSACAPERAGQPP
jgi:hypothetical protein